MKRIVFYFLALLLAGLTVFTGQGGVEPVQAQEENVMKIHLPPRAVFTPRELRIEGKLFTFANGSFSSSDPGPFSVSATITNPGTGLLESYRIDIAGFTQGGAAALPGGARLAAFERFLANFSAQAYSPPPASNILCITSFCRLPVYDIQMTFVDNVTVQTLGQLAALVGAGNALVSVRDSTCSTTTAQTHLCFWPAIELVNFLGRNGTDRLLQAVELSANNIIVEGNVFATESIAGFVFPEGGSQRWVAVGGTVSADISPDQSQRLNNYIQATNSTLRWGNGSAGTVGYQLGQLKTSGVSKATTFVGDHDNFNLNSRTEDPGAAGESSFSSGPAGKIWYKNGDLVLSSATVSGVGTVIVNGNLTVEGPLTCQSGTRFGAIATGNITFTSSDIDCGAYVALGETAAGNIVFNNTVTTRQIAKGIFIAKNNVILPEVDAGVSLTIQYDTTFALEPSALFSDLLQILFTTVS